MKKVFWLLPAALFVLSGIFFLCGGTDWAVSRVLSRHFLLPIKVYQIRPEGLGKFTFSKLSLADSKNSSEWLLLQEGQINFRGGSVFSDEATLFFKKVTLGDSWKYLASNASWFSPEIFDSLGSLEHVRLKVSQQNQVLKIRVLSSEGKQFYLQGGAQWVNRRLAKLDLRLAFSPATASLLPATMAKKMAPVSPKGWGSLGLSYGVGTWTLRGLYGPLLQLSANNL